MARLSTECDTKLSSSAEVGCVAFFKSNHYELNVLRSPIIVIALRFYNTLVYSVEVI